MANYFATNKVATLISNYGFGRHPPGPVPHLKHTSNPSSQAKHPVTIRQMNPHSELSCGLKQFNLIQIKLGHIGIE